MATYGYATTREHDWRTEAKQAMRDALKSPAVFATLIVCATILGLALLGVLGWLAWAQRDASTVLGLVNLLISAFLLKRVSDVDARASRVEQQTNGHTTRLMDVALKDKE